MGLNNFKGSGGSTDSSGGDEDSEDLDPSNFPGFNSGGSKGRGGGSHAYHSRQWATKIDFSTPYILIAEDKDRNIIKKHKGIVAILTDNSDWRRMEDHPDREMSVLFRAYSRDDWLRFCSRAIDQENVDPRDLLEDEPEELHFLRDKVHYPPAKKPDTERNCRVCGSPESKATIVELDLEQCEGVAVCSSHQVGELTEWLASEGLLSRGSQGLSSI